MFRKTRLFTPGPTPLVPAAQFAMAAADMHHRTPEFRTLYSRVLAQMKQFIGTQRDVIILTSSGTGAMEAAVSNLTTPGDKVLVISAGKFGERWTSLVKAFGCVPETVTAPYGETVSLAEVKAKLTPDIRAVFMQATETSTGVRHDVHGVAELVKNTNALLIVDAITGLGTTHLNADSTDVIIGGSQKALMVPPGISYLSASDRAWQRIESSRQTRYYFDLRKERKAAEKGEAAYTPAVALIAALGAALDYLGAQAGGDVAEGRRLLVDNAERCAAMTRAAVGTIGMELFASTSPSAAVTAVKAPAGVSSSDIIKRFRAMFGGILSDGQGEMKGQILRIAHIGFFDYMDTIAMIGGLEHVLAELTPGKFELGAGLRAAQRVYAEQSAKRSSATGA